MRSFAELSGAPLSVLQSVKRPLRLPGGKREARSRAEALEEMGVLSVLDLLTHYPRRYLDRTSQVPISELKEGDDATVIASIRKVKRIPGAAWFQAGRDDRRLGPTQLPEPVVFQPALACELLAGGDGGGDIRQGLRPFAAGGRCRTPPSR